MLHELECTLEAEVRYDEASLGKLAVDESEP